MKIILIKNTKREIDKSIYDTFLSHAKELQMDVILANDLVELENLLKLNNKYTCVVIFGGDGTLLTYTPTCATYDIPILSINMGKLGFLSQLELIDVKLGLSLLKEGKYYLDTRNMLNATYNGESIDALNEVLLCTKQRKGTTSLNVWIDSEFVDTYIGDGVILSTPTGSTAYSLSAGGPVVYPNLDITLLTPLCAHSLRHCPIVLSNTATVKIQANQDAACYIDGVSLNWEIESDKPILISKSDKNAKFIKFRQGTFFSKLFKKLSIWNNPELEAKS